MLKAIIGKLKKKKDNDVDANVAWLEHNNNKCYTSAFRYIYRLYWSCGCGVGGGRNGGGDVGLIFISLFFISI